MKKTVCVELDGVLAERPLTYSVARIGSPVSGARQFLLDLSRFACVVIYTTRCVSDDPQYPIDERLEIVEGWLRKHDLPYDYVYSGRGKVLADAYVDDRAVSCKHGSFSSALSEIRSLCST